MQIQIHVADITLTVTLRDTPTAQAILAVLPIESRAQTWGEEVYFGIPVSAELEPDARDVVTAGELAFWVEGSCIAIGFGSTPISQGNEIRLAARTNIWADTSDDVRQLAAVQVGEVVRVEPVD
ncbi:MAG: hypothetical protein HKM94_10420 [Halobacteria archaeon]|nr:hypothetical protein [Halobacteria archaeon]